MIRAYTGGNRELQLTSLGDTLGCQVGGPERLRDDDGGVDQFFLKHAVRTVLVGGDDQRVTLRLEKLAQAELAGHAPEQLPRPEIDRLGRWSSLTAGVVINVRNVIACKRSGIPGNGIFVKHTDDLGHGSPPQAAEGIAVSVLPSLRHSLHASLQVHVTFYIGATQDNAASRSWKFISRYQPIVRRSLFSLAPSQVPKQRSLSRLPICFSRAVKHDLIRRQSVLHLGRYPATRPARRC